MESIYYWLWLVMVFGAGNRKIWKLVEQYETPQNVYEQLQTSAVKELKEREQRAVRTVTMEQVDKMLQLCGEKQLSLVCYDDENYPERLRHIYNPPSVLFYQGKLDLLTDYPALTVVGTRKPSAYSAQVADTLCRYLAKSGILIVSGFAVGLDSVAHRAALLSGGKTIAVMGCGLDVAYPKPNASSKKYIVRNGLILTEFLPGTEPTGRNFPQRNRILAGVSSAVLVIQAPVGSGALITAEQAMEQGKTVFCIPPADIFDNQYAGVVKYLREGAVPVFAPEDILHEYYDAYEHKLTEISLDAVMQQKAQQKPPQKKADRNLSAKKKPAAPAPGEKPSVAEAALQKLQGLPLQIMQLLIAQERMHIDQIVQHLQADAEEVAATLTELALEQYVQRMPGQYYGLL